MHARNAVGRRAFVAPLDLTERGGPYCRETHLEGSPTVPTERWSRPMRILDILNDKGGDVVTISPGHTVLGAMKVLVEHDIGAVVVEDDERVGGLLSERDVLRIATRDPTGFTDTKVEDVMTTDLVVGVEDDRLDYVMDVMTRNRVRHLPIMRDEQLVGIVSIGDVVNALRRDSESENRYLRDYIASA
jgi:CBS domain-containing protein